MGPTAEGAPGGVGWGAGRTRPSPALAPYGRSWEVTSRPETSRRLWDPQEGEEKGCPARARGLTCPAGTEGRAGGPGSAWSEVRSARRADPHGSGDCPATSPPGSPSKHRRKTPQQPAGEGTGAHCETARRALFQAAGLTRSLQKLSHLRPARQEMRSRCPAPGPLRPVTGGRLPPQRTCSSRAGFAPAPGPRCPDAMARRPEGHNTQVDFT